MNKPKLLARFLFECDEIKKKDKTVCTALEKLPSLAAKYVNCKSLHIQFWK